jgi:hypothetical protein
MICAWCEHEGKTVVLAEREPVDDLRFEYAICDRHTARLVARLHKYFPPGETSHTSQAAA